MSGLYPYCVLPLGHAPAPGLEGLGGRPVYGQAIGSFTVWVSDEDEAPLPELDRVVRHNEVVRSAIDSTTPLPVRFGSWAPDLGALTDRILRNRTEIDAALAAVADHREFGVRVSNASSMPELRPAAASQEGGRGYLRSLSSAHATRTLRREEQNEVVERLRSFLRDLPAAERVGYLDAPELVSVAHLVHRDDEARYRAFVADFVVAAQGKLRVHLTGPWPPYSFAST